MTSQSCEITFYYSSSLNESRSSGMSLIASWWNSSPGVMRSRRKASSKNSWWVLSCRKVSTTTNATYLSLLVSSPLLDRVQLCLHLVVTGSSESCVLPHHWINSTCFLFVSGCLKQRNERLEILHSTCFPDLCRFNGDPSPCGPNSSLFIFIKGLWNICLWTGQRLEADLDNLHATLHTVELKIYSVYHIVTVFIQNWPERMEVCLFVQ